ncbi:MAG: hypothetical protein AMXMBFR72_31770 [Betaproteobacteria bacterium]
MTNYYDDWKEQPQTCRACGWQSRGCDLTQGEVFAELFEVCCPKCGEKVLTVSSPTIDESRRNWDKVSPADRIVVELAECRRQEFERRMLRSPEQLPDLPGNDLVLVWDYEDRNGHETVIRFGAQELWREPAFFEGCERFGEIAEILFAKYGTRLQDLVPTRGSQLFLYGDRIGAPARIEKFRQRLGQRRRTP